MSENAARRWGLLATVSAGLLLIALDNSILYAALPALTGQLGASGTQSLWIINAYPAVMAGVLLGAGTLGDRIGHRRMFLAGLVIFGAASLWAAFSPSPASLIAARAVLALGAAAMMPSTLALIRGAFEIERERNIAIAVWGSTALIGAALGPVIGGLLLEHFWWGSVFLLNVPVVLAALIVTPLIAPADAPDPGASWDASSSALAMTALMGAVFLIKELARIPPDPLILTGGAAAAGLGSLLFARRQRRLARPLLDFSIFRDPAFSSGVLAAMCSMLAIGGIQFITTQHFQLAQGLTPLRAGLSLAVLALGALPFALLGGAILHRTGLRPLISGGLALAAAGTGVIIAGAMSDRMPLLVAGLAVAGAGTGAAMSVASSAIVGHVPANRAGMASAVEEVSYEFGSLLAVTLLGSVLSFSYSATVRLPDGAPAAAQRSFPEAVSAARGDAAVLDAAMLAFGHGYLACAALLGVMLLAGAACTARMLRAR